MTVKEFVCLDCGLDIVSFGESTANDNPVCGTCSWIRSLPNEADRERLRTFLNRHHAAPPQGELR